jgi:enamine deaminase RidA (YjgF/YER057c/UK114 family)
MMSDRIERLNFPALVDVPDAPYCSVVQDEHYAHLAGIVAADFPDGRSVMGDAAEETRAVMRVIRKLLAEIGLTMRDIVRCDVHLADFSDMPAMNAAYAEFFPDGLFPARTTTQSGALFGGGKVEVTCMARRARDARKQD